MYFKHHSRCLLVVVFPSGGSFSAVVLGQCRAAGRLPVVFVMFFLELLL